MKQLRFAAAACCLALGVPGTAVAEGSSAGSQGGTQAQSQGQGQAQGQGQGQAQGQAGGGGTPVLLIVPMMTATDQAMANGCWARLYDSTGYKGNMLTLSGPVDIPSMESGRIAGFEWDRNFDSVHVGPGASLMVWQGNDYTEKSTTFRANQRVQDLDERMGFFEDIKSVKLSCISSSRGGSGSGSGSGASTR